MQVDKKRYLKSLNNWSAKDSEILYSIGRWGKGYFSVNQKGHLCVNPEPNQKQEGPQIDIINVIEEMKNQGIQLPAVIRFHDILRSQVKLLNETFRKIIKEADYKGQFTGVYPIKVNQMREVVEEIVDAGEEYNFGLEAGSKTEILVALALNSNNDSLTITNGYKDEDFIQLALLGRKIGRKVLIVVEKFSELPMIIKMSRKLGVEPLIGLRSRLSCKGSGKWQNSSGDNAKFGLNSAELLNAVQLLEKEDLLHCLKLFHFHLGSQVTDIRTFKEAIAEGGRVYAKLCKLGVPLEYFDVGGGLAVDYDGSNSTYQSSMNYHVQDYVSDVVYMLKEICELEGVPHPNIVTESGRAITAHHSCVVTNVFGTNEIGRDDFPTEHRSDEHHLVTNMRDIYEDITPKNLLESYNDAKQKKDEAMGAFKLGVIDLIERAVIETLYWKTLKKIVELAKNKDFAPEDVKELTNVLVEQYMCNFSVFQSAADSWAIGQLLPIVPLNKLDEKPTVAATLADITCDSDGKIDRFIDLEDVKEYLPLHNWKQGDQYYLGLFLTGAYQDIMGDNHNLFGRLNEVHVFCDDDDPNDFYIEEYISGNSARDVLKSLQYSPVSMASSIKKLIDKKVHQGKIRPRDGVAMTDFYENCLKKYTYLRHEN